MQGGEGEELGHELVRVGATLEVNGDFQAVQTRLISHVRDLPDFARLDELRHLVNNGLHGGGVWDFGDFNEVFTLGVVPLGPQLYAAPAGAVNVLQGLLVVEQLAPGGEVRGLQNGQQVRLRVLHPGDGGLAHLPQVEPAQVGGHAHGDALVGRHQHVGEGGGQQGGLLELAIVVGHKVHGVLVNVPEQFLTDGIQPHLGVSGGGPGHVPGVHLAEVTFGVHQGVEQSPIAPGEAHHGVVNGDVAVGIELHGGAHHVGALGAGAREQLHLVHGVQQLAVAGLEAVDFRDGPGDDHRHGVGHVVQLQGLGDGLLQHLGVESHDVGVCLLLCPLCGGLLLSHVIPSLS